MMTTLTPWKARKLQDLPQMTGRMMDVLLKLMEAKAAGVEWVLIEKRDKRTEKALLERDWIQASAGAGGSMCYRITRRGERACNRYRQQPPKRTDGICPDCGERPRHVLRSGKVYGYCSECMKKNRARNMALKGVRKNPDGLCPRCKKRKRVQYDSGFVGSYCRPCTRYYKRREKKRMHKRLLARIAAGEVLLCRKCNEQPRYHSDRVCYDYCYDCYRAYQSEYNARRKAQRQEEAARRERRKPGRPRKVAA